MTETKEPYCPTARPVRREVHADARGWLFEGVRSSEVGEIAQVYVTLCYPGVVKGWHRHEKQTDRMVCVQGIARVVTARVSGSFARSADVGWARYKDSSELEEHVIGPLSDKKVVVIPPGLWHAFTPAGNEPCVIVNCPDREYDGTDEFRVPLADIPYAWNEVSR